MFRAGHRQSLRIPRPLPPGQTDPAPRGASAFCLPSIDRCVRVPCTAHQIEFIADQITAENQGIVVEGFAVWKVNDPVKTCASFDFSDPAAAISGVGNVLRGVVESATRHQVATMRLEDVVRSGAPSSRPSKPRSLR